MGNWLFFATNFLQIRVLPLLRSYSVGSTMMKTHPNWDAIIRAFQSMHTFLTESRYLGLRPCKNPDYTTLLFVLPEHYRGVSIPLEAQLEANCRIVIPSSELSNYQNLQPNSFYKIRVGVSVSNAKDNYKPSLNFDLVQVVGAIDKAEKVPAAAR